MSRDSKFSIQDLGEIENIPVNPNISSIEDFPTPNPNPKLNTHHEFPSGKTRFDTTPVKQSRATPSFLLRTPDRQGVPNAPKNRFGFSSVSDELRSDIAYSLGQSARNGTPRVSARTSSYSDTNSTHTTPTKSVSKPPNPAAYLYTAPRHPLNSATARSRTLLASTPHPQLCVVNTLQVPHFDLKEDTTFWMDHNVQVIIRVRPVNSSEKGTYGYNRCVRQESAQSITWIGQPESRFTFDHVACETVDQDMLFRMAALPMVENCLSGYNSCIFAYGQTGSGKTYTMLGDMDDIEFKPSPHRGMTPRIFEFLFARISAEEESRRDEKLTYSCKCSFLEIYNEQITDLLDPSSTNLLLREDAKKGVYVENLSEFEVHTVGDVLQLLIQGSSNRKVAATNMNRESSRSHCVFTCIIESKWERDSTTNLRFARLNLVDLAGSERQKTSGAEGERLKEAANINKSLSTLGHVIMLLVDIAHGKPRHVPYRDSRLTFLLQDSLGGNSKTMIIANVSPSICCAAETLNTLKFAQRAKMIQNNAVVNEDSSGDVAVLQHQIWLLKEELSALKRQNVSRTLAFDPSTGMRGQENNNRENVLGYDQSKVEDLLESEFKGAVQVSSKQFKYVELMLAGALRREEMTENSIKKLEAEIEQLNRLVRQREEDTRCTKMMLKFREDKIQRMESLLRDLKPADAYLLEENAALSEEIQMLRAKIDRNPEVTRFAVENIRLMEQVRRFQEFYEDGERDLLMKEVSELRAQLIRLLDVSPQQQTGASIAEDASNDGKEKESLQDKLTSTANELSQCKSKLTSCLEANEKLSREIENLHAQLRNSDLVVHSCHGILNEKTDVQLPHHAPQTFDEVKDKKCSFFHSHGEEIVNLELELDILKIILKEERLSRGNLEELAFSLTRNAQMAGEEALLFHKQCEDAKTDLEEAKSVIAALDSQQLLCINEMEELKKQNTVCLELLHKQELQISSLKEQAFDQGSAAACLKHSDCEEFPLQEQLKRMQASLDKAKKLNKLYQSDHASQRSNEEEIDEIRRQAEAETAEVIVCLQDELSILQKHVEKCDLMEKVAENRVLDLETKLKELQECFDIISQENSSLRQNFHDQEMQIKCMTDDWELLTCEIEEALVEGHNSLRCATDELGFASISDRRGWISEQMGKMVRQIFDKESLIEELSNCLEEANVRVSDMEHMLLSLRGAAVVMAESHQQECYEKEKEIVQLSSELKACLSAQKEETHMSERNSVSLQSVEADMLNLQAVFSVFGTQCESKLSALNQKLDKLKGNALEAKSSWRKKMELFEYELVDAKSTTTQKALEASSLLVRFEEVQEMMKEADIMINGLMIANETMKLEIEDLRNTKVNLAGERDGLIDEVHILQSENDLFDTKCKKLEQQVELDASTTLHLVEELQDIVFMLQGTCEEAIRSLKHDFYSFKSQLEDSLKHMHSSLEEIWSEVLTKNCALSVLHHCHVGVLLEAVTGLNTENDLLHQSCHESNALVHGLREQNMKSKEELELFRVIRAKQFSDIKSSFDRISSKEGETRELKLKLKNFEENLAVLQCQEELMLQRSNLMGSELDLLMKEMDQTNAAVVVALAEQKKLLKSNAVVIESQAENHTLELYAKDLEVLFLASELKQLALQYASMEKEQIVCCSSLDCLVREIVTLRITADLREQLLLAKEAEIDCLDATVNEAREREERVSTLLQGLEAENTTLREQMSKKENDLDNMQNGMFLQQSSVRDLQNKLLTLEEENESLQNGLLELKSENSVLGERFRDKESEVKLSTGVIDSLEVQNCELLKKISVLESRIALLENDLETNKTKLFDFQHLQSCTAEALSNQSQDLESYTVNMKAMKEDNLLLREELQALKERNVYAVATLGSNMVKCVDLLEMTDMRSCKMLEKVEQKILSVHDKLSQDSSQNMNFISKLLAEIEYVDYIAKEVVAQKESLQEELVRKDEISNGLLFDLQLLQESAANSKDQEDAIEELEAILESTQNNLATKSREHDEAVTYSKTLQDETKEQRDIISALEGDLEKVKESMSQLSVENSVLRSHVEDLRATRSSVEKELCEKTIIIDSLENELLKMGNTLGQMNGLVESLKSTLDDVTNEKDHLQNELLILEGKLETVNALAGENEAIAVEAQQIAESRRIYAEEKDEEVQLLERSVQELDSTICVLESKVDALREEAEKQRLQREELELELHSLKNHMHTVENADGDVKRQFNEKTRNLQEALTRIKVLENDLANKDTEVAQCKAHISELTLHAEAQACEYKQKFKDLEAMVEQVKAVEASSHDHTSSCNKLEKNPTKGRGSASPFKAKGSGSPFKCIGLGLTHQLKSEKEEELNAERIRIEELEALAASRQKEIFMLNARLAATESMTHDVIRDLLGVKLDMSNCANLLDKQHIQKIREKAQTEGVESPVEEVIKLRKELTELIEERQGWLDEIDRRQTEFVAAQIALEKHRQHEQLLTTENGILKKDISNHKKRVVELEEELQKLSGQQNLQQRIHHHAKIKEENSKLKLQNDELVSQLREANAYLKRMKEAIASVRVGGRSVFKFEEEERFKRHLEEIEKEKRQVTQMLFSLCKSIAKAAGLPKPTSEIDISAAEDALEQLRGRIMMLEREVGNVKMKKREGVRVAEVKEERSSSRLRSEANGGRNSQSQYFCAHDR